MPAIHNATVVVGSRVYQNALAWKRKDKIFLGHTLIGIIQLSDSDRLGVTTSIFSGAQRPGRAIEWCVQQCISAVDEIEAARASRLPYQHRFAPYAAEIPEYALA